jgi:hypothetical protein
MVYGQRPDPALLNVQDTYYIEYRIFFSLLCSQDRLYKFGKIRGFIELIPRIMKVLEPRKESINMVTAILKSRLYHYSGP